MFGEAEWEVYYNGTWRDVQSNWSWDTTQEGNTILRAQHFDDGAYRSYREDRGLILQEKEDPEEEQANEESISEGLSFTDFMLIGAGIIVAGVGVAKLFKTFTKASTQFELKGIVTQTDILKKSGTSGIKTSVDSSINQSTQYVTGQLLSATAKHVNSPFTATSEGAAKQSKSSVKGIQQVYNYNVITGTIPNPQMNYLKETILQSDLKSRQTYVDNLKSNIMDKNRTYAQIVEQNFKANAFGNTNLDKQIKQDIQYKVAGLGGLDQLGGSSLRDNIAKSINNQFGGASDKLKDAFTFDSFLKELKKKERF